MEIKRNRITGRQKSRDRGKETHRVTRESHRVSEHRREGMSRNHSFHHPVYMLDPSCRVHPP